MSEQTDRKTLLEIKKYLDNGFSGYQAAEKAGVCPSVVSRLRKGYYGAFPGFDFDVELRTELRQINLEKMRKKLSGRKVLKLKK